jgi:hypothetical protein
LVTLKLLILIVSIGLPIVVVALLVGWWRIALAPLKIRPGRMTVSRLGLGVHDASNIERVNSILASFLSGFNRTLTARSLTGAVAHCDAQPALNRPFAHEGLAMAYTPRRLMRYSAEDFETRIVKPNPEFRYLYYVGLGFWAGMRNQAPHRLSRITEQLDPLHRFLCFDGYGFKIAFFDWPKNHATLRRLDRFNGYERNAAYQGVGRALYFLHMDEPERMIERTASLGDHAVDAAAGIGLAAVFVSPDRLERAIELAAHMPASWQPHVHLGMCFGLKARSINDLEQFERDVERMPPPTCEAIFASIRECDRLELLVRSERVDDGYRVWRQRVTAWMEGHVAYPLQSLKGVVSSAGAPARKRAGVSIRNY